MTSVFIALLVAAVAAGDSVPADTTRLDRAKLSLRINLPAFRLELYEGDSLARSYRAAIGAPEFPTPSGTYRIGRVDWDPWWIPPASEWAIRDTVTPPGPQNPMGRVRLAFRDLYFVHGTPLGTTLGSPASHGCIRLSNADAVDLAVRVLRAAAPSLTPAELETLARERATTTRSVRLAAPVALNIRYEPVRVDRNTLWLYEDVYRLIPAGAATDSVIAVVTRAAPGRLLDTAAVRFYVEFPERPLAVPLDRVLIPLELLASAPAHP